MAGKGAGRVIRTNKNIAKQKAKSQAVKQAKRSSASQSGSSEARQRSAEQNSRNVENLTRKQQHQQYKDDAIRENQAKWAEKERLEREAKERAQNKRNQDNVNRYSKEMNKNKPKESAGPSFTSTGQQGLDKIRFHESRGANISDQQRRSALSGDMRRNFSEQGGINRVGVSALRGAVVGGVAGGGIESMQGGDFWDGAKSGAFYGATGMAGLRATRQAVGAQAYRGKDGIMGTMKMNKEAYGVGVKDLMLNQQNVGRAKDVMNSTRKK